MNAEMIVEAVFSELKLSFIPEYRFHEKRKWRIDYFLPEKQALRLRAESGLAGGIRGGGGFSRDCEKYNEATVSGIRILRYPAHEIVKTNGLRVYADIQKILEAGE